MLDGARARGRAAALGLCLPLVAAGAVMGPATAAAKPPAGSPAYSNGHPYRHGVVPLRGQQHGSGTSTATSTNDLNYGGGISGVGVTTAPPKVYLVFWGSQWGTQGTNSAGNVTLSGDPSGMAPYVEAFLKGIGTNSETWSGVMTQYCQGVAAGSQSCPANAAHVGYPAGGAFAGVWVDESAAAPSQATGHQIGVEAVSAATHFGNTTQSSNLPAQYVIVSPHGTHPDGFNTTTGQFCAWHDYTGDSTLSGGSVSSPDGLLAFTNLPYITDMGTSCGQNFVNAGSAGTLDGVSIVEGHEYAETVTDTYPAGGWTDSSGNENGDKCAWISSGQGASQNITLGTGTFAVQSTWANDYNSGAGGCEVSHPIVGGGSGGNTVTVTNPGNQTGTVGSSTSLQIQASDSGSSTLTYSATGLPAGLSINSTSGLISGTPTTASTYSVTVTAADATGASGTAAFTWTVNPSGSGGITNGGFEAGSFSGWTTSGASETVLSSGCHGGTYCGRAGSTSPTNGDSNIVQTFTVPAGQNQLTLFYKMTCPDTVTYDWATVTLKDNTAATTATVLPKTCTTNAWTQLSSAVTAGHSYTLTLTSHDDNYGSDPSYTLYDDVALSAAAPAPSGITNGGFETGSFSGWTTSGASETVLSSGCHGGTYCGRAGSTSPTNGDSNIVQTFTASAGATSVALYYKMTCPDTVTYDWATVTLKDNTAGTTATVLPKTCTTNAWTRLSSAVTAGHSYTLTLTSHDDNYGADPSYTLFDDVTLQ